MLSGSYNPRETLEESRAKSFIRVWSQIAKMKLTASQKAVLREIAFYDQLPEGAHPSEETLAARTGYTERTVRRVIRQIEERVDGFKAVERRTEDGRRLSNHYEIDIEHLFPTRTPCPGDPDTVSCKKGRRKQERTVLEQDKPGLTRSRTAEHLFDSVEEHMEPQTPAASHPVPTGMEQIQTEITQANEVVELFARLQGLTPTAAQLADWVKTARIMLGNDHRPFEEICRLLTWACCDEVFSGLLQSVFDFRALYPQIQQESAAREPRPKPPPPNPHRPEWKTRLDEDYRKRNGPAFGDVAFWKGPTA